VVGLLDEIRWSDLKTDRQNKTTAFAVLSFAYDWW
jgi:hypothetical protein